MKRLREDRRLVVVSDLHLAAGPLGDFDADVAQLFVEFCRGLSRAEPCELVINGDFIDFPQSEPFFSSEESVTDDGRRLCFTEQQSVAKFYATVHAHRDTFLALESFLASDSRHRLVIIPGNHDADLYWPTVQAALAAVLKPAGGQLEVITTPPYRPSVAKWLWIEHGHEYDPVNAILEASATGLPFDADRRGEVRLIECIGTRLLLRVVNLIDRDFPFIDNVKPLTRLGEIFLRTSVHSRHHFSRVAAAVYCVGAFLAITALRHPSHLLDLNTEGHEWMKEFDLWLQGDPLTDQAMTDRLSQRRGDSSKNETSAVLEYLIDKFADLEWREKRGGSATSREVQMLTLAARWHVNETDMLRAAAQSILTAGKADGVIFGHTHDPVAALPTEAYINTGSWTRNATPALADLNAVLENDKSLFGYRLLYAERALGGHRIDLKTYREQS
jgi:UDP-2,3-diacylglucosamine pyrophosphatase LpxH